MVIRDCKGVEIRPDDVVIVRGVILATQGSETGGGVTLRMLGATGVLPLSTRVIMCDSKSVEVVEAQNGPVPRPFHLQGETDAARLDRQ